MVDSSELKVPYDDLQKYLKMHDTYIVSYLKQEEGGAITRAKLEKKLSKSILKLQECLTEIC